MYAHTVLGTGTITVMEHHDQSNLGKKDFIWLMISHYCSLKEVRPETPSNRAGS